MSQTTVSGTLREALVAHQNGFPTRAIPIYEKALIEEPDNPDALSGYGLALVEAGRPSEAEGPLKLAIEKMPNRPAYHLNLAELYFRVGEDELALVEIRQAIAIKPKFAPAHIRLGRYHIDRNEPEAAADALDVALQINPNDHATGLVLANALASAGNYGAAYYVLDHLEKIRPDDVRTIKLRLVIARFRRDYPALEALATRLTTLQPDDPQGWRDLATAYFDVGRFEDALAALDRAMPLEQTTAESLGQYALTAIQALDFAKANSALARAEALDPTNARTLSTKALLLTYEGKKEEAEAYCRRCLDIDPHFIAVYPQLSVLRNGWLSEQEEKGAANVLENPQAETGARAMAAYVVAHNRDARGDIDGAFDIYSRANSLAEERNRSESLRFDFEGHSAWVDAITSVFRGVAPRAEESYHQGPQPIFIIGLPRCGSTLVESVISAHSEVDAGGEMPMMANIFNQWFKTNHRLGEAMLLSSECAALATSYMAGVRTNFDKPRFTDKNLLNIEAAGLIAQIFPKAVIINVRRNPVENGFAIWRQDMLKFWTWTTNFEDIAKRYGLYARIVDHFERVLAGRFVTIQYEDFVGDFAAGARNLISLCGLDWEDACLEFQNSRVVAPTFSAVQVREGVSLKGNRASLYGARLDPLRRALEENGVDLATGALRR